jgi:hypothetical protein
MLGIEMARLNTVTARLVLSHKLCEILRKILLIMPQGYSLLAPVRPESMHIFYATSAVTAIATKETIRLVIQIPPENGSIHLFRIRTMGGAI